MNKFILFGNGSFENRGCEAITRSTVKIIEEEFGPSQFVSCPTGGDSGADSTVLPHPQMRHHPTPYPRFGRGWWLRRIDLLLGRRYSFERYLEGSDLVLGLGGDSFSADYQRNCSLLDAIPIAARACPFVLWGASITPIENPAHEEAVLTPLRHASLICARERKTYDYLRSRGFGKEVVQVADPAFVLEPESVELPDYIVDMLAGPCVGLNLSPLLKNYVASPPNWVELAKEILEEIREITRMPILLIPHKIAGLGDDYEFLNTIRQKYGGGKRGEVEILPPHCDAGQTKWVISQLDAFVGARTHATIASLSSAVPTISIAYSIKAMGINLDIFGDTNWVIDAKRLSVDTMKKKLSELMAERAQIRQHLKQAIPAQQKLAFSAGEHLRKVIERH